jgi:Na+/H+-dicarboxylate symporter
VGLVTLLYYFVTMAAAVILGVMLVTWLEPGRDFDAAFRETRVAEFAASAETDAQQVERASGTGLLGAAQNILLQMIPENPVQAAAEGQLLPTIAFSLLLGVALTLVGDRARPVVAFMEGLFAAVMMLVECILWLAPLGVACLIAWSVAAIGSVALVGPVGKYMFTVLLGLSLHAFITLPLVLKIFGNTNPYQFLWQMRAALMTAFGTDSSSVTLPVTIETAQTDGGCSKRASEFVLPLGATINMDGTALYEAVAVVFLFQCFAIDLTFLQLATIVITATLAAVGAAGIPSAGLVTMVIVIEAVNTSLGSNGPKLPLASVGIILGVDRILDMCRTTVNVWGDSVGARLITRIAPDAAPLGEEGELAS